MQVHPGFEAMRAAGGPDAEPTVVAIGNFDGVHRGHRAVLDRALEVARERGHVPVVLTFEPHPRELFGGEQVFRLTPAAEKRLVLERLGFHVVVEQPFDRDFASLTAAQFMDDVLADALRARHVVVGDDFRFGAKRVGDAPMLAGHERFDATLVGLRKDGGEEPVSSSRARAALARGEVTEAARMLGRRWRVGGPILHGRKVGRTIDYPTANMALDPAVELAHGIYAVRLRRADGTLRDGVASFGSRPTFDDGAPLLETFVFDFEGDLYGEEVHVSLFEFLRGEEKFDGVEALVAQMDRDSEKARATLAAAEPMGELDRAFSFDGLVAPLAA